MKNIIPIITFLCISQMWAQKVDGRLSIDQLREIKIELKNANAVDLFKQFKEGKHQIVFTFKAEGLAIDNQKRQVALVEFETQVYKNGKLIGFRKRAPMPFFPGEMLEPVETFDIINLLMKAGTSSKSSYPGQLASGHYEIKILARTIDAVGEIAPASLVVHI
ncbi:hypothetical protein [Nonlabens xiamenensis]|uniref:hypothetical protein n=1 Tax=Nonlabens xiamenensis TaxID=2341043 RepID=UPI000F6159AB|nr:hypothetical protein [Nonlabens xiamenensis]